MQSLRTQHKAKKTSYMDCNGGMHLQTKYLNDTEPYPQDTVPSVNMNMNCKLKRELRVKRIKG